MNLLEDINLSSILIGYAGALNSLINAIASKKENKFNSILKNKSLTVLSLTLSISALVAGINAVDGITIPYAIQIVQIIAVVQGVIGTYLLGQKAINSKEE